jgi:hypothetical protein
MEDDVTSPAAEPATSADSAGAYRRARRSFGTWRRKVVDPDDLRGRQRRLKERVDQQAKQLAATKETVAKLRATITEQNRRIRVVELASEHREREHGNLTIQVGQQQQLLGEFEERLREERFITGPEDEAEARRLIDEIRQEHERIRVRMQAVGQYEDRLRRIEATVADLTRD